MYYTLHVFSQRLRSLSQNVPGPHGLKTSIPFAQVTYLVQSMEQAVKSPFATPVQSLIQPEIYSIFKFVSQTTIENELKSLYFSVERKDKSKGQS